MKVHLFGHVRTLIRWRNRGGSVDNTVKFGAALPCTLFAKKLSFVPTSTDPLIRHKRLTWAVSRIFPRAALECAWNGNRAHTRGGPSCCLHAGPAFVSPRYRYVMGIVLFLGLLEAASIKSNLFRAICTDIVPSPPPNLDDDTSRKAAATKENLTWEGVGRQCTDTKIRFSRKAGNAW